MTPSSVPSTATVVDFICLFTHDLKRKQKRWQDGVLKYHTFNKRVMVYDDRSHFIGDAHWQGGGDLEPGDEFELDRGSAIVQVSDCTGKREQDLTELLDKRAKEVEKRRSNAGTRTPRSTAATAHTPRNDQNTPHFRLRHRPLNDLVGGATRTGRAVIPPHSPYQVRKMAESPAQQPDSPTEDARPSKRRRQEESPPSKMGHARALFGTTLTLTPFSSSVSAARSQALPAKTNMKPKNTSMSTRTDVLDASKRTKTSSEAPPCSKDPEEPETRATNQTAPRRVFTQRASLKELLAGNEQNWNEEHPPQRESISKGRPNIPGKARPFLSHNSDNSISLFTQTEQSERLDNAVQNLKRSASTRQVPAVDKSSRPIPSAVNVDIGDSSRNRKELAETNDDAFLSWLAQGDGASSGHQTPIVPTNLSTARLEKSKTDRGTMYQKTMEEANHGVAQNPIQIDEDEQSHPRKVTQTRPRNATPKPPRKNQSAAVKTHGTKRPLSTDRDPPAQTGAVEPPPAKEPRTELRIRSRQRRGLLMVAQNKQGDRAGSLGRLLPLSLGTGSDAHTSDRPAVPIMQLQEESGIAHDDAKGTDPPPPPAKGKNSVVLEHPSSIQEPCDKSANNFDSVAVEKVSGEESNENPNPMRGLAGETPQMEEDSASDNIVSEKDRASATPPRRTNPSRRTRGKAAQVVLSDNEEEIAARNPPSKAGDSDNQDENSSTDTESARERQPMTKPKAKAETSSGPRITKMSRKSVKSREIIGFTIPVEDFPPPNFGIGGFGQPKIAAIENMNITTENPSHRNHLTLKPPGNTPIVAHQQELARELSREDQLQKKPVQGKQTLGEQPHIEQTIQQPQIKQLPRISNPATRGKKAARKQDAAGLPPQTLVQLETSASSRIVSANSLQKANPASDTVRSELPGFCRPNGGAWSRHAEDLLGMTRPSKAPPRQ
ncbi:unnamed protein product [Fusarium graminearum]|uniref:5'-3' DNA helicase ZGRF1-like N-terminal domain-containing protein n=1 Tax=Gibberella zeae TaxID=5518 RepID=A0A2H3H7P7_GIBZA|nr:hypothetical protein FGRA07_09118 [Fusarium graminearum]CAF3433312.1 unnamed protein product [Fusarium graminearum]CAF3641467.1 unnamed protein product [Fusarium graminearum]CAG1960081.1 unnamed protein product [Fusarium graminearum]VTO84380.1 unnamed protein product [Fusarium graminearum]